MKPFLSKQGGAHGDPALFAARELTAERKQDKI